MNNTTDIMTLKSLSKTLSTILPIKPIDFTFDESAKKKQMLPSYGINAISPFLKSVLFRSIPELILVSKYTTDKREGRGWYSHKKTGRNSTNRTNTKRERVGGTSQRKRGDDKREIARINR